MTQDDDARISLVDDTDRVDIFTALDHVEQHIQALEGLTGKKAHVWANPSVFDHGILAQAYRETGRREPWSHRLVRCARTLKDLAPKAERPEPRVPHDALEDAVAQMFWVQNMYADLKGRGLGSN